jgi:acetyl-CoA acetyltransferase
MPSTGSTGTAGFTDCRAPAPAAGKLVNTVQPMTYEAPYRPINPASSYALAASRHMHEFGTTREMLASVAVKNHYNGARDPYAHFQNEITVDDVLK